jgi:putative endopeptidase
MDSAGLEKLGYQPIQADLDRIAKLTSTQDLLTEIAFERSHGIAAPLVGLNIGPDRKNVSQYIPQVGQGGISLPDRDYYLKNDARSAEIRKAYAVHLKNMFHLIGRTDAAAAAGPMK